MSENLGWLVTVKGADRMATRPAPFHAVTEDERDWYLRNTTEPDRYDVTPITEATPEILAKVERHRAWLATKAQADTP